MIQIVNTDPHSLRWGFFVRLSMVIQEGYFYHIKDSFYQEVNDNTLMSNKEDDGASIPGYGYWRLVLKSFQLRFQLFLL